MATELYREEASTLARRLAQREITAEAVLRSCLDRIAEREPVVQAWEFLDVDAALAQARAIDAGPQRGLLHGLPVAVKDLFDTFDMPTTYGSTIYAKHRPLADAASVALCRGTSQLATPGCQSAGMAYEDELPYDLVPQGFCQLHSGLADEAPRASRPSGPGLLDRIRGWFR